MEILSTLSCPHVVKYKGFDVSKERNRLCYNLLMEYVAGGTVVDEIRRRAGRLDEQTISTYTCQILKGVEYLHSNGVVHCDIKGSNILISEDNRVKLADFGCAKRDEFDSNDAVSISGTPAYMAPETARGEEQGFAADIWAVGCTVIEMATGGVTWLPDCGSDPARILYRIAFSDHIPAFPSSLSDQGKDFLSKCLVRDPKQRWAATELLTHPFVSNVESLGKRSSNSPTSVLDHQLWNASDDESESASRCEETQMDMEVGSSREFEDERMEQLASVSGRPSWSSDEDWVQVRSESGSAVSQIRDACFSEFEEFDVGVDFGRCRCDDHLDSILIKSS